MTDESEMPRVPGFIYLDMDRVKSISSRLDEGYIKSKVEERERSESVAESITGSIRATIFGIGSSVEGESSFASTTSSRTHESKALHHYYFDLFEEWIEDQEGNWFFDINDMTDDVGGESALPSRFRSEVEEGDLVRLQGPLEFQDFNTSLDILDGFIENADALDGLVLQQVKEQVRQGGGSINVEPGNLARNQIEEFEPVFNLFNAVMPEGYQEMVSATVCFEGTDDIEFWMLIQDENLEYSTVELIANHSNNRIPNCTIIGRVESIKEDEKSVDYDMDSEEDLAQIFDVSGELARDLGFAAKYPAVSISPIAIYR
ncbi:hypothetical protein GJ633_02965 [Halorubrum sp. CBA1125]|uniref:DUF6414 family protein n=1 Tax=Halorubrum sp. CBA1125 TaxID=2668072 RepID=UPI0012E83B14|nr:hypothetical protein [Halorubrum sp. CBA1125]MUW13732.1 hypothetical protein [Halorubrum sp. CBA1125]